MLTLLTIAAFWLQAFVEMPTGLSEKPFVVVLDAGHGGHDPGNMGNGYLEKNIALKIVLQVGKELEKQPGLKVIYTRKDDTFVNLYKRGEIANKANADLFVSVHCDSHTSSAHGAGTFVLGLHANKQNFEIAKKENSVIYLEDDYQSRYADYDINSPESVIGLTIMQEEYLDHSILLAKKMQDYFSVKLKRVDRKVKQAGFIVLHQTFMPSVLVETGFLTNKREGAYLNSSKGQGEMALAIAQAILDYKKEIGLNSVASVVAPQEGSIGEETAQISAAPKTGSTETSAALSEAVTDNGIHFKIQLMASSKDLALVPKNFGGLDDISQEPVGNLFRYLYGNTPSYAKAKAMQAQAMEQGFPTCYIVAYRNGERIPVEEAVKVQ